MMALHLADLATWALYLAWAVLLVALPWAWIAEMRKPHRDERAELEARWIAEDEGR